MPRKIALLLVPVLLIAGTFALMRPGSQAPSLPDRTAFEGAPALPLAFEQNLGQADEAILFAASRGGRGVYLTADSAAMALGGSTDAPFRMRWADGNPAPRLLTRRSDGVDEHVDALDRDHVADEEHQRTVRGQVEPVARFPG